MSANSVSSNSSLVPYPTMEINSWETMEKALTSNAEIGRTVSEISDGYPNMGVQDGLLKLAQVGSLLQLSYAGTKGYRCSSKVIEVLNNYQSLMKDSYAATHRFVSVACEALNYHRLALVLVDRKAHSKGMELLSKTAQVAEKMVKVSQELVDKSQNLCEQSKDAFVQANNEATIGKERKEEVEKTMAELRDREASLKQKAQDLAKAIGEARQKEEKAAQEAKEARDQAFTLNMISVMMQPVVVAANVYMGTSESGSVIGSLTKMGEAAARTMEVKEIVGVRRQLAAELEEAQTKLALAKRELMKEEDEEKRDALEKEVVVLETVVASKSKNYQEGEDALRRAQEIKVEEAKSSESREAKIQELRFVYESELRQLNGDLAESISKLGNTKLESGSLDVAIHGLELSVKALGKVKTIFENARLFWKGVHDHCEKLSSVAKIKEASSLAEYGLEDEFTNAIKKSGLSWLALGKMNHDATIAMQEVNRRVDSIMSDLPTSSEAGPLIEKLSFEMMSSLELENSRLSSKGNN